MIEEDLYGERLAPGALVGRYLVEALAHEGGFAAVYRARDTGSATGDRVALKVLKRELAVSSRMIRRFQAEADTVNRLHHPSIVRVLELSALSDGRPYIAMEWLEGRNLAQELAARGAFPLAEAMALLGEIAAGLSAAHAQGVVHRDLKPENVVVIPRGEGGEGVSARLVDFGIAKLLEPARQAAALTSATLLGTPQFMAPEQILGEEIDARTDVYAFGLLAFQILSGRPPFRGADPVEIEEMHLHAPPPRVSVAAPVPEALDRAIAVCLAKRPDDRWPGIERAMDELVRASRAVGAGAASTGACLAVGAYIEAVLPDAARAAAGGAGAPADEEAVLAGVEAALATGRALLDDAGLELAFGTGSALLGARLLPDDDAAARSVRASVLRAALEAWGRGAGAGGGGTSRNPTEIRLQISVHAAGALRDTGPARRPFTGGALFRLGDWVRAGDEGGVFASPEAVAGLEEQLELVPASAPVPVTASPGQPPAAIAAYRVSAWRRSSR